ncbi:alpha/beta hydrolase [Amycolatopsis sp. PS_44_ISF1]|uniref:alpha/beta fold hydrolase n=1 Tax=Amycolatopsis sp. PS_44_ISF1 TaxID=2974917 RepID=UPI0028E00E47|nr:alpha/beta hydrolase [Amycolatopsis sp. PS_44_ISF1]MDT8915664.1 alpha/beta hydrolase [Amycolatopsis sp. PS_44_ISF1]
MINVAARAGVNLIRTGPRGGPPVVLLHSGGLDLTYWEHQIGALRDDRDVIAFDLPGHGATPGVAGDWTEEAATDVVLGVLRGLGRPVHLVGLSLGGMLAQTAAVAAPESVSSLTLIDTAAQFSEAGRASMRARAAVARSEGMPGVLDGLLEHWFTAETRRRRPDLVDRAVKTLLADDPLVHAAMWEMIAGFDRAADLPSITCPALVVVGEHDSSSPLAAARQLRDGIPGARLRVVPSAAHLSPLEKPAVVHGHLTGFLATLADA